MAQYRLNAYDADVFIPEFKGLLQYGDPYNNDLRYSPDCMNVETPGGVLQPAPLFRGVRIKKKTSEEVDGEVVYHYTDIASESGTIMHLHTKLVNLGFAEYAGGTKNMATGAECDQYYFFLNSKLYLLNVLGDLKEEGRYGATEVSGTWPTSEWSWTTYEIDLGPEEDPVTHAHNWPYGIYNALIFSHATKGLFASYGGGAITDITSNAPSKFSFVARYADRIWGVGTGDTKDSIFYSRPYSYSDWSQDNDDPAMGGGEIREPTFDKDKLVALVPFGDALIAFSEKRAWKITGSDPTNFMIQEQYGNGCKYPDTIAVMNNRIIMLGEGGLVSYDGYQVQPFLQDCTHDLFRHIFEDAVKPQATKVGDKYVLAFSNELVTPTPISTISDTGTEPDPSVTFPYRKEGYSFLVFDSRDGDIVRMDAPDIMGFCNDLPLMLVTSTETIDNTTNRYTQLMPIRFDSWYQQRITGAATRWVSPWITFGRQDIKKGGFELYFTPEILPQKPVLHQYWKSDYSDYPSVFDEGSVSSTVKLKFSIQTEKKTKSKEYTIQPLSPADITAGKEYKMKRLHFGGSGRRFRLIIETAAGGTIPWRLIGGIHIIAETDKD